MAINKIDIIIPVYNAFQTVVDCVESVLANTPETARLILINDASPDPRIASQFSAWAAVLPPERLLCLHNPVNLGVVKTLNRALVVGNGDVVVLNSDTLVTPGWLDALQACAALDAQIASITPFSNNAEICSYPVFCTNNQPRAFDLEVVAKAAAECNSGQCIDIPVGVSFCIYLRRSALDAVGLLDADTFGRGYGEENDLCMRFKKAGYRNVLCPSCFVLHLGGHSFATETSALKERNQKLLADKHPEHNEWVARFIAEDPTRACRDALIAHLAAEGKDAYGRVPKPGILLVSHHYGGGVEKHVSDQLNLLSVDCRVEVLRPMDPGLYSLADADGHNSVFQADNFWQLVQALKPRHYAAVVMHHTHGHAPDILTLPRQLCVPYAVVVHDFAAICPQNSLEDDRGRYCGEPDAAGCTLCLSKRPHPWGWGIVPWREHFGDYLHAAAAVIAPSTYVAAKLADYFPLLNTTILPHPPLLANDLVWGRRRIKVALLGRLSPAKGLNVLTACAKQANFAGLGVEFALVGYPTERIHDEVSLGITHTGEYDDERLPDWLARERADLVWFPGQIPETFSYTLTVALASGLPVLASDHGAIAERLKERPLASYQLLPYNAEPTAWLDAMQRLSKHHQQALDVSPEAERTSGLDARHVYREHLLGTLLGSEPQTGRWQSSPPLAVFPAMPIKKKHTTLSGSLPMPVRALLEHGLDCGNKEAKDALRARVRVLDDMEQKLFSVAKQSGQNWTEYIDRISTEIANHQTELLRLESERATYRVSVAHLETELARREQFLAQTRLEYERAITKISEEKLTSSLQYERAIANMNGEHATAVSMQQKANALELSRQHEANALELSRQQEASALAVLRQQEANALALSRQQEEVACLRSELGRARSELDRLDHEVGLHRHEVARLKLEELRYQSEIGTLQQRLADCLSQIDSLEKDVSCWAQQADKSTDEWATARNNYEVKIDSLHNELRERDGQHAAMVSAYEASTSWRVTRPIRIMKNALRKWRYKLGLIKKVLMLGWRRWPIAVKIIQTQGLRVLWQRVDAKLNPPMAAGAELRQSEPLVQAGPLQLVTAPRGVKPIVSVVIPVYGQHQHTYNCLLSMQQHTDLSTVEIIVVDDCSPEPVTAVLADVTGVKWLRNRKNLGFIGSCNAGAKEATGEHVLLLNNDVQVTNGWLNALLSALQRPHVGMVGAKLVYPDGRLQEAGGILWQDGSAWNWGRGKDPDHPYYEYVREVDYCSGACLMLTKADWDQLKGFDTVYKPAYYEDTDLAFRVRQMGKKVVYQPAARIVHYEGVSSGTDETKGIKRYQVVNQVTFFDRWKQVLANHRPNADMPKLEADRGAQGRILIVEACMITPDQDSGSVRMLAMLELLRELGCQVTFVAENLEYREPYVGQLRQLGVEVWHWPHLPSVANLLENEGYRFDVVMLCRHYIATPLVDLVRKHAPQAKLVFDTVDLHFLREQRLAELENSSKLADVAATTRERELAVIRAADVTYVVSPVEKTLLSTEAPGAVVEILSNIHSVESESPVYSEREGLIFVGGFQHPPNVDAVNWFVKEVWPAVIKAKPALRVRIVGSKMPDSMAALAGDGVEIVGFVEDLEPLLNQSRISIAPLRYGAGVKGKVNQAMAHGLPVVATQMAVEGMNLSPGENVMVAQSPSEFAEAVLRLYDDEMLWSRLSVAGKLNVAQTFSRDVAKAQLEKLFRRN